MVSTHFTLLFYFLPPENVRKPAGGPQPATLLKRILWQVS